MYYLFIAAQIFRAANYIHLGFFFISLVICTKKNIPEFLTNDVFTLQQGGKMGSKNGRQKCNLFNNIASKRVSQVRFAFYHTRIKPVLHQIRLLHVAKSCCRKLRVVTLFATNCVHVARFTGLRQTCFAISDVTPVHGATLA